MITKQDIIHRIEKIPEPILTTRLNYIELRKSHENYQVSDSFLFSLSSQQFFVYTFYNKR